MKTASWVIVENSTGVAVFETFSRSIVDAINTSKYKAIPILKYLQTTNKKVKQFTNLVGFSETE